MLTTVNLGEIHGFHCFSVQLYYFLNSEKNEGQKIKVLEQKTSPFLTLLAFEQCQDLKQIILGRCVPV